MGKFEIPPFPDGTPSGKTIDTERRPRPVYKYYKKKMSAKEISHDSTKLIANQMVENWMTPHQKKRNAYSGSGTINIKTLAKGIHHNHTPEVHQSIMRDSRELLYANLYYGGGKVRIESNGSVMAIFLHCRNTPHTVTGLQGWKTIVRNNRILLYTEKNNLISGDVNLFKYATPLRIFKAEIVGADEKINFANINIENVDYWEYLGVWETLTDVPWENYKGEF